MSTKPIIEKDGLSEDAGAAVLADDNLRPEQERQFSQVAQPATGRALIAADGLRKSFGAKTLWNDLTFEVYPGEMVALTGVSGSGKTTLLNILGLLEQPDAGTLTIAGQDATKVGKRKRQELYRGTIAFLFQNYALVDSWTVGQNLDVALAYSKKTREEKSEAKGVALECLGLAGWEKEKVYQLSGGEQQRVALARLLLKEPGIIIADEPTAALDEANGEVVFEILRGLRAQGAAIVLSTHDQAVASRCDAVLQL